MPFLTSLSNRIFFASALLAVLSLGVAFSMTNFIVTRQAEADLGRDLDDAAGLVEQYRATVVQQVAQQARLIADLPKFKAAVELDHIPTLEPLAKGYQDEIAADLFVVTNRVGRVLTGLGLDASTLEESPLLPALAAGLRREESTTIWATPERLLQVVTVPIWITPDAPEVLGTLSVGFGLNGDFARQFKNLTTSDLAFRAGDTLWLGTLPPQAGADLAPVTTAHPLGRLELETEEFGAKLRPLRDPVDRPSTAASRATRPYVAPSAASPSAIVLRSRTEHLRPFAPLRIALAATAVLAVLFATLLSYAVARTITRPLGAVTAAMREVAVTGDVASRPDPLVSGRWADEDAQVVASAFNAMTRSIGAFQKEVAQRERLSALGRLSTVVAHEIRNPLMIVKAALRTLRRHEWMADAQRAAVADIDAEVNRLDKLVDEVLDFAKPIRFTLETTDLRAVCESARAAVDAGDGWPRLQLTVVADDTTIVTDGERLRMALVNTLANAKQALLEARSAGSAPRELADDEPPGIEIVVGPRTGSRILVAVRDRGPGIPAALLPRIFDPFVTTRRTGSGIGLAITKNIIEGLGGRIAVTSTVGHGTEFLLELPSDARGSVALPA
ncbi:MAG: ATP-binding protein [Vicinamibacterales bacterium]